MDQKEEFKKNLIAYYNCKMTPGILNSEWSYDSVEDDINLEKRIKVAMRVHIERRRRLTRRNFISMTIIVRKGLEYPICGFSFDLDKTLKKLIEDNSFGCGHPKDSFEELKNIFKAWDSNMDEFIEKLKLLNISLL